MRIRTYKKLHQLTILNGIFPVNCYVYEESNSLTVIDIGTSFFCKSLIKLSDELKKPITKILLTHPHADHIGGLDKLKEKLPNIEVIISKRDFLIMKGDFTLLEDEKHDIKGGFAKVLTEPDVLLEDGMKVDSLLAISTPGHTPGSMSFYDEELKILIVGDAFQVKGGVSVAGDKRILFPFPALATWNKEKALLSAKRISKLDIDVLATGHGDMLMQPKELILEVIKRADSKLRAII